MPLMPVAALYTYRIYAATRFFLLFAAITLLMLLLPFFDADYAARYAAFHSILFTADIAALTIATPYDVTTSRCFRHAFHCFRLPLQAPCTAATDVIFIDMLLSLTLIFRYYATPLAAASAPRHADGFSRCCRRHYFAVSLMPLSPCLPDVLMPLLIIFAARHALRRFRRRHNMF